MSDDFCLSEKIIGKNKDLPEDVWLTELLMTKDVKEFIKRREARLRNQIRIHWNWLKEKAPEEVSDFIIKIANAEAGDKLKGDKNVKKQ